MKTSSDKKLRVVGKPLVKKDAAALITGKPVYTDDIAPADCLIVKVLRSPHANAEIVSFDLSKAEKVDGVIAVYTYKDVPDHRFTMAGQTYPEPSPYDRLILDRHVRYVGDPVAIVAGENEKAVDEALRRIKVEYNVLPAVLDFRSAKDNPVLVHPEESWKALCDVGADNKRNLCAHAVESDGDVDAVFAQCDIVTEGTYHTLANQQAMMEPFSVYCFMDTYGRLNVVASTQIVFHARRILSTALGIPKSKIRVSKPRIGGGFGAKQSLVAEIFPAFVTWKTGRASKMIFTRTESQTASSPRHEMEVTVKLGAMNDGKIRAIEVRTLSNTGAYGEHGPTTVGLSGHKSIPLYSSSEAFRFTYDVVYTNVMSAGAYRGYGATQGIFAVESAVNELAAKLGIDPVQLRMMNMVREGDVMPAYYGERTDSCALDRCLMKCAENIGWAQNYPCRVMENGKIRAVGIALAMQGSGISGVDVGSAHIRLTEDGIYTLSIAAADMGTGCDTILAQMAAECMECSIDRIVVSGADTDTSPYDSGSYASSTTYVTGKAVEKACEKLKERITEEASRVLGIEADKLVFEGNRVIHYESGAEVSLEKIAESSMCGSHTALEAIESNSSPVSPPPFMAGAAEIELDPETGEYEVIRYEAAVDCGTVINPNLARVQVEGGLMQAIGMTMTENIQYSPAGKMMNGSFMQYKIPSRLDMGTLNVEFEPSSEPTGPFGAKSIGEIVINTPAPAIAHALFNATGAWHRTLPITAEKVWESLKNR